MRSILMSKRTNISKDQLAKCNAIIHGAAAAAGGIGTGLAQIPLSDSALITPIQIAMIIAIGGVFKQKVTKSAAQAIISGAAAAFIGRAASQVLVGWIPVVGNAINTATAAGLTEAIGWMAVEGFSQNKYSDVISQTNEEEIINNSSADKDTVDNSDDTVESVAENLKRRANEFITGEKTRRTNKDEYYRLLNDFEKAMNDAPVYDELNGFYNILTEFRA